MTKTMSSFKTTRAFLCDVLLLSTLFGPFPKFVDGSALKFNQETRAYEDLLVEITKDVAESEDVACNELLKSVQVFIYEGSMALSKATDGAARIATVNIMIPKALADACAAVAKAAGHDEGSPGHLSSFQREWIPSSWEAAHSGRADLRISSQGKDSLLMSPHTIQHGGCGESGLQMHFPAEFISEMETSMTCDGGRMFLAEFAKYRYGVFDEHGFLGDSSNPLAYVHSSGAIKPTSCSNVEFPGQFSDGQACLANMTSKDCLWMFSGDTFGITSSVMSHQYIERVTRFCDDESHNVEAPNKHNLLCEERSVMDVIRSHPDFATPDGSMLQKKTHTRGKAPPIVEINVEPPEFKITVMPPEPRKPLFMIVNKWIFPHLGTEPDMGVIKQPPMAWRARCRSLFTPLYFLSNSGSPEATSQFTASFVYSKSGLVDIYADDLTIDDLFEDFGNSSTVTGKLLCNYRHPAVQPALQGEAVDFHEAFEKLQQNGGGILENGLSLVLVHAVDYDYGTSIPPVMQNWVDTYKIPLYQVVDGPSLIGGDLNEGMVLEKLEQLEKMKELSKYGAFVTFEGVEDDLGLTQARFSEAMTTGILPLLMPERTPILVYSSLKNANPLECKAKGSEAHFDFNVPMSETKEGNLIAHIFGIPDDMIVAAKEGSMDILIELTSPSGILFEATNDRFMGAGVYMAEIKSGEAADLLGQWTLKTTCKATNNVITSRPAPSVYFSIYMVPQPKVRSEPIPAGSTSPKPADASNQATRLLASADKLSLTPLTATQWQSRLFLSEHGMLELKRPPVLQLKVETEPHSGIPVIGLDIVARVTKPEGGQVVEVDLYDNGLGTYDTTANDGIYSNFFVAFDEPGYYQVDYEIRPGSTAVSLEKNPESRERVGISAFELLGSSHYRPIHRFHFSNHIFGRNDVEKTIPHENFDVEELCCGHHYPHHATAKMAPDHKNWIRYVSGPTFVLKSMLESSFPVSRITDLSYDFHENWGSNGDTGIWLRWTMPEEVFLMAINDSFGTLDYFDLRWSRSREILKGSFETATPVNCNGDMSFNDLYYCHCLTYDVADSFYVALRVNHVEGSSTSNIIRISVPGEVVVPTTTMPPEIMNQDARLKNVEQELERAYIILGCCCAFLFLVAVVLVGFLFYGRKKMNVDKSWLYRYNRPHVSAPRSSVGFDPEVENRDATDKKKVDIRLVHRFSGASSDHSGQLPNQLSSSSMSDMRVSAGIEVRGDKRRQKPVRVAPPVAPHPKSRTILPSGNLPARREGPGRGEERHKEVSQNNQTTHDHRANSSIVSTRSSSEIDDFTSDSESEEWEAPTPVPTITVHAPADGVGAYNNSAFELESKERQGDHQHLPALAQPAPRRHKNKTGMVISLV